MKKIVVLTFLFVLPIVAYLFFASGVNTFSRLPVVTESIPDLPNWSSLSGEQVTLNDKITVLGFPGTTILEDKSNSFNLNQLIFNKNKSFDSFQIVMVVPVEARDKAQALIDEFKWAKLASFTEWKFVFATKEEILSYYSKLGLVGNLNENAGTSNVFIIDKERNLRGRKGINKKGIEEYKEGYNTISPADLKNEMEDDFKIILYEYRAALKKNLPKREI